MNPQILNLNPGDRKGLIRRQPYWGHQIRQTHFGGLAGKNLPQLLDILNRKIVIRNADLLIAACGQVAGEVLAAEHRVLMEELKDSAQDQLLGFSVLGIRGEQIIQIEIGGRIIELVRAADLFLLTVAHAWAVA
ncbi:hypothetical protein D3C75_960410 [compost metagenome]